MSCAANPDTLLRSSIASANRKDERAIPIKAAPNRTPFRRLNVAANAPELVLSVLRLLSTLLASLVAVEAN